MTMTNQQCLPIGQFETDIKVSSKQISKFKASVLNIPYMRRSENDTLIISDQSASHTHILQLGQQFKSLASGLVNVGEYSPRRIRGEQSPMITQPVNYGQSLFLKHPRGRTQNRLAASPLECHTHSHARKSRSQSPTDAHLFCVLLHEEKGDWSQSTKSQANNCFRAIFKSEY